jgi:hypothetical protein
MPQKQPAPAPPPPNIVFFAHNFRTNVIVCKQIHTVVCQTVFIIIVTEVTPRDDTSKGYSRCILSMTYICDT